MALATILSSQNMSSKEKKGYLLSQLEKKLETSKYDDKTKRNLLVAADLVANIFVVLVLVLLIRTFIMSPFQVSGISMCNTLNYWDEQCHEGNGDYLIINKSSYLKLPFWTVGTPQRGDIIVFRPPQNNGEFYIKRVIGLPGETVKLIDGYVYIYNSTHPNGVKLDEPYLSEQNQGKTFPLGGIEEFKIPAEHYVVFGDNRQRSSDSRLCFKEGYGPGCETQGITPYITVEQIEGKAAVSLWPKPRILNSANYPEL